MNVEMTTNSQLSTTTSHNNKLSKQPEQEQNHRYGDHVEGGGSGRMGEKKQELRSINGRYKTDREMLRIAQEMEKPKYLYAQPRGVN